MRPVRHPAVSWIPTASRLSAARRLAHVRGASPPDRVLEEFRRVTGAVKGRHEALLGAIDVATMEQSQPPDSLTDGERVLFRHTVDRLMNEGHLREMKQRCQALRNGDVAALERTWQRMEELDGRISGKLQMPLFNRMADALLRRVAQVAGGSPAAAKVSFAVLLALAVAAMYFTLQLQYWTYFELVERKEMEARGASQLAELK